MVRVGVDAKGVEGGRHFGIWRWISLVSEKTKESGWLRYLTGRDDESCDGSK